MLEAYAHNYLKNLLKKNSFAWPHNLTLSRLISRSLRRKDRSFIQLETSDMKQSWPGVLVPLCLHSSEVVLVLTTSQRQRLLSFELPRLKLEGLHLSSWEGPMPPTGNQLWLLDHLEFFKAFCEGHLHSKQLIIPEAELLSSRLRDCMSIKVCANHWDSLRRAHPSAASALIKLHERLTRKLFAHATCVDGTVRMDFSETVVLMDLVAVLGHAPSPWPEVVAAIRHGWASWAELDHKLLDWCWNLKPLEPLKDLHIVFERNSLVLLSLTKQNDFFLKQLEPFVGSFDVKVKLGDEFCQHQEPIQLFAPRRQPLPNTEYFAEHLLDQCRRLILGRKGITIILLDDYQLLRQLTSELAAEFGKRVILESTSPETNGVICCQSFWWMNFQDQLPIPEQLILGILPFPSLELPLTAARVDAYKRQGQDWFRDLLLPELLNLLPRLIWPIRKHHGRIAILDGRLRSRSWGERVLKSLEPWTPLERLLPD